jgi:hypothetical protein
MAEDTRKDQNQPAGTKPRHTEGRPGREDGKNDQDNTAGKIGETKPASPGDTATDAGDPKRRGPSQPHQGDPGDAQNQRPMGNEPIAQKPH